MLPLKKLQLRWTNAKSSEQQEWNNLLQLLRSTDRETVHSGCSLLTALEWDSAVATLLTNTGIHCHLKPEWNTKHADLIASAVLEVMDVSDEALWKELSAYGSLDNLRLLTLATQTIPSSHPNHSAVLSICQKETSIKHPDGDFWIHQYPVTQIVWSSVSSSNPSCITGSTRPVVNVSWMEAIRFCNRLSKGRCLTPCYQIPSQKSAISPSQIVWNRQANGFRLPTESEWLRAAKAQQVHSFAGSDSIHEVGWANKRFQHSGIATLPAVGQKQPNAFGLFDCSGTVFELCWDGEFDETSLRRVKKGGGWSSSTQACKIASRYFTPVDRGGSILGFRIVRNCDQINSRSRENL